MIMIWDMKEKFLMGYLGRASWLGLVEVKEHSRKLLYVVDMFLFFLTFQLPGSSGDRILDKIQTETACTLLYLAFLEGILN